MLKRFSVLPYKDLLSFILFSVPVLIAFIERSFNGYVVSVEVSEEGADALA